MDFICRLAYILDSFLILVNIRLLTPKKKSHTLCDTYIYIYIYIYIYWGSQNILQALQVQVGDMTSLFLSSLISGDLSWQNPRSKAYLVTPAPGKDIELWQLIFLLDAVFFLLTYLFLLWYQFVHIAMKLFTKTSILTAY